MHIGRVLLLFKYYLGMEFTNGETPFDTVAVQKNIAELQIKAWQNFNATSQAKTE